MKNNFRIEALPMAYFNTFLQLSENDLVAIDAYWVTVTESPGYPCRVTLEDAEVGERVLVCSYEHHPVNSAYRAAGPIFVREQASRITLATNEVPAMLLYRQLSVRAYNECHLMIKAKVVAGIDIKAELNSVLADQRVNYIHIHNAAPGCFMCAVKRA